MKFLLTMICTGGSGRREGEGGEDGGRGSGEGRMRSEEVMEVSLVATRPGMSEKCMTTRVCYCVITRAFENL